MFIPVASAPAPPGTALFAVGARLEFQAAALALGVVGVVRFVGRILVGCGGLGVSRIIGRAMTPVHLNDIGAHPRRGTFRHIGTTLDDEVGTMNLVAPGDRDGHAMPRFHIVQELTLLIEDIQRDFGRRERDEIMRRACDQPVLDRPQHRQRDRFRRSDGTGALAMGTLRRRAFQHARTQPLPRHFQQAEVTDPADLDARAVVAQAFLDAPLDRPVVALLLHIDVVDHDQSGEIPQLQLARDLLRRFHVGLERGILDIVLARRLAGVDVDRDQGFRLIDDDVATRAQRDDRAEHGVELTLDLIFCEQRFGFRIGHDIAGVARHQHLHEVVGVAIGVLAGDHDLVDLLGVEVADRAFDQIAFLVDERRRRRTQCQIAHALPNAQQILEIALDLGLGARRAGRAHDQSHALRHFQVGHDLAQALAIGRVRDLAGNAAAARGVGHQYGIAAGERQIRGERRALVAAFLFDHLHQNDLAALDDLLDLVDARGPSGTIGDFLDRILGADGFDLAGAVRVGPIDLDDAAVLGVGPGILGVREAVGVRGLAVSLLDAARLAIMVALVESRGMAFGLIIGWRPPVLASNLVRSVDVGSRALVVGLVRGSLAILIRQIVYLMARLRLRVVVCTSFRCGALEIRAGFRAGLGQRRIGCGFGSGFRLFGFRFLAQQRLPVGDRDLIIVGMNFAESQEAVPIAAVVDECRLQ